MQKPRLEKIFVAFDGAIKAVYEDNTLLILSAEGQSFTHVSPGGVKTVQLCEFCLNRFATLLTELLDFRNQHIDVPALCKAYTQQLAAHGQLFQLGYPILDVCWPTTAEEAFEQGLVDLPDKQRVTVHSRCSSAHIVLEYTGLRFAVTYPLLVEHNPASNTYTYTWQTQVFSRNQYPFRWQPALAIATAVAENAAQGFRIQQQHQQHEVAQQHLQQQQQVLSDLTNTLISTRCSTPRSNISSPKRQGSPLCSSCSSPSKRYGSPLQRQHRAWQQQPQDGLVQQQRQFYGSPASDTSLQRAWQQQQQQHTSGPATWQRPWTAAGSPAVRYPAAQAATYPAGSAAQIGMSISISSTCITKLPIHPDVLQTLPISQQQLHHHQQLQQQQLTSNSISISTVAAAMSQALGQRPGTAARTCTGAGVADTAVGRGWWLEPSLMLPTDELLQMVWSREATVVYVEDVDEVEVWLHADDSCLYSFQAGAFITHLLPKSAAAAWDNKAAGKLRRSLEAVTGSLQPAQDSAAADDLQCSNHHKKLSAWGVTADRGRVLQPGVSDTYGLIDGVVDAADMSRVYAASALPELPVPAAASSTTEGSGLGAAAGASMKVPVGQIAAAALKFRSAMARVKRCLAHRSAGTSKITTSAATTRQPTAQTYAARADIQQSHQQQSQTISAEVKEQQDVPGVGRFTAYADGRVRVVFADRTICNLAADHQGCRLLLPDGTMRTVAASNPVGVEQYVQCALEFAAWSSTSPEERAAALRLQALVAAELRSSARMAAICEWGSARTLPEAAAPAAVGGACADAQAVALLGWKAAVSAHDEQLELAAAQPAMMGDCNWSPEGYEESTMSELAGHPVAYGLEQRQESYARKMPPGCDSSDGDAGSVLNRQLAVEQMLQANACLLERLKV